ncbi:MAG: hypothetical protein ACYCVE_06010, partial [Gemmatimonadaceae bacterium]
NTEVDLASQTIREIWAYDEIEHGLLVSRRYGLFKVRYCFRYEMEQLLRRAGFQIQSLFGGFDRSPYSYGREQIWVCSREN